MTSERAQHYYNWNKFIFQSQNMPINFSNNLFLSSYDSLIKIITSFYQLLKSLKYIYFCQNRNYYAIFKCKNLTVIFCISCVCNFTM